MEDSVRSLTLQLLSWTRERPRTYAEAMDAWKTHCPRFTIWEDALSAGLLRLENVREGGPLVALTEKGAALLSGDGA
jgi:hypothetical protein